MKRIMSLTFAIVLLGAGVSAVLAAYFLDDFNDGNADGWWLGSAVGAPSVYGNWRVENGELVQDSGVDGVVALIEGQQYATQLIVVDLTINGPGGGNGPVFWYVDNLNLMKVNISNQVIEVGEEFNGEWSTFRFDTQLINVNFGKWYNLGVDANSTDGSIDVYLDGTFMFTHNSSTPNRVGQTGIMQGNAGGHVDNFAITSVPIQEPLTDKDQCKHRGWESFTNPSFKNQGDCVRYLEANN